MFICQSCHDKSNCEYEHIETSFGICEECGTYNPCFDCLSHHMEQKSVCLFCGRPTKLVGKNPLQFCYSCDTRLEILRVSKVEAEKKLKEYHKGLGGKVK